MLYLGEIAALAGSFVWSAGSMFFTAAVARLGVWTLNLYRTTVAACFLLIAALLVFGVPFPEPVPTSAWLWLGLSALVGLAVGDLFYFGALKAVGPRLTMLLFSLAPPIAAATERLFLGARLGGLGLAGMAATLVGVTLVVMERPAGTSTSPLRPALAAGIVMGVLAAACQAVGLVFSKMGVEEINPLTGTLIRMAAASFLMQFFTLVTGRLDSYRIMRTSPSGLAYGLGGALFGPTIGVTLSLIAAKYTSAAVATTLLSTTPITILPYTMLIHGERVTLRGAAGAAISVMGVAMLFMR